MTRSAMTQQIVRKARQRGRRRDGDSIHLEPLDEEEKHGTKASAQTHSRAEFLDRSRPSHMLMSRLLALRRTVGNRRPQSVVRPGLDSGTSVNLTVMRESPAPSPASATTPTPAGTPGATPAATPDPDKISGKEWWDANEGKSPYIKSDKISDLESDFQSKVNEFESALKAAGASISIDTTKRPAERAHVLHYAWQVAKGEIKASAVPSMTGVDITWDHGSEAASKKGAQEILDAATVKSKPSLTSNHIDGKAIDWTITWTGDLKIKKKDGTEIEIKSKPRSGGDPGNTELHSVGEGYGVIKGLFTGPKQKRDAPHWSSDGS